MSPDPAHTGPVRSGLEERITGAVLAGEPIDPAEVALARTLADHVDLLDDRLRAEEGTGGRTMLTSLAKQYAAQLSRTFPPADDGAHDPFADFLAGATADADRET